jgi:hypothetical protein
MRYGKFICLILRLPSSLLTNPPVSKPSQIRYASFGLFTAWRFFLVSKSKMHFCRIGGLQQAFSCFYIISHFFFSRYPRDQILEHGSRIYHLFLVSRYEQTTSSIPTSGNSMTAGYLTEATREFQDVVFGADLDELACANHVFFSRLFLIPMLR